MNLVDPDALLLAVKLEIDVAVAAEGLVKLGDLVVFREVRVEVILAIEDALRIELAVERPGDGVGHLDRLPVERREYPGVAHADGADVGVGLVAEARAAVAEYLRFRLELNVDLEADE